MEPNIIVQLVSALGFGGVLAWYCWFVTSTTLPRIVAEFREENRLTREDAKAERVATLAQLGLVIAEHKESQATLVREHKEAISKMAASVETMVAHCAIADARARVVAELSTAPKGPGG
jgi:hypothetical protein